MSQADRQDGIASGGPLTVLAAGIAHLNSDDLVCAIEAEASAIFASVKLIRQTVDPSAPSEASRDSGDSATNLAGLASQLDVLGDSLVIGDQRAISMQLLSRSEELANQIRLERLRQAKSAFNVAIALAGIGVLLIFTSAALVVAGVTSAAIVSTVVAGVSESVAVLMFRVNKQVNDRLEKVGTDIATISKLRVATTLINGLSDQNARDRAVLQLLRQLSQDRPRQSE